MSEEVIPYASREVRSNVGREVFGAIVRSIGLVLTLYGIYCAAYFALMKVLSIPGSPSYPHAWLIAFGVMYVVAGVVLFKGEWIVRLAYGKRA